MIDIKIQGPLGTWPARWNEKVIRCKGKTCGQDIGFAKTPAGAYIPIDVPEIETDNEGVDVYEPHHATCTDVDSFR